VRAWVGGALLSIIDPRPYQAALAEVQGRLAEACSRADLTGRIGRHLVTPGNLAAGGDAGAPLLASTVSLDPIEVHFDVDRAASLRYVRPRPELGQPASRDMATPVLLALGDETAYRHRGTINLIDNVADASTGTGRAPARPGGCGGRGLPAAVDPSDLARLPPRRAAPGASLRRGGGDAAIGRRRGLLRDALG
jgi:multidrug efflux pump subunit AcrA (membrane-fusion protein)